MKNYTEQLQNQNRAYIVVRIWDSQVKEGKPGHAALEVYNGVNEPAHIDFSAYYYKGQEKALIANQNFPAIQKSGYGIKHFSVELNKGGFRDISECPDEGFEIAAFFLQTAASFNITRDFANTYLTNKHLLKDIPLKTEDQSMEDYLNENVEKIKENYIRYAQEAAQQIPALKNSAHRKYYFTLEREQQGEIGYAINKVYESAKHLKYETDNEQIKYSLLNENCAKQVEKAMNIFIRNLGKKEWEKESWISNPNGMAKECTELMQKINKDTKLKEKIGTLTVYQNARQKEIIINSEGVAALNILSRS